MCAPISIPARSFPASYHTYTWTSPLISPLVEQRIVASTRTCRPRAGSRPAVPTRPTSPWSPTPSCYGETTLDTFYTGGGYAGWGWRGGMGMGTSTTTVRTYTQGTLIVDLFDARTKQAVWRGTGTATVPKSPSDVNATVQAALDKMFANFPPGTGK